MVTGTAKLVIDLGNSSTRVTTQFGNTQKGNPRTKTIEVSNAFAQMSEKQFEQYKAEGVYTEENSRVFVTSGGDIYCNGELCDMEFEKERERPTAMVAKFESLITKWSVMNAFGLGYTAIAEFANTDIASIDVDWEVTVLLPPDDVERGSKVMIDLIKGIDKIDFKMPEIAKKIKVNIVKVFPEGFAAFIAVVFEGVNKLRESYKYLVDPHATVLISDIGAGTTDFLLIKGGKVVYSSRFTRRTGGNNVHQTLRRDLRKQGIVLKDTAAREACEQGFVYNGAEKMDVIDMIASAKREVSRDLIDALIEFFESTMVEVQSINYILPIGGGAVESDVEGIHPISQYMVEYLQSISPNLKSIELPVSEDGTKMDARLANVIGASILAG